MARNKLSSIAVQLVDLMDQYESVLGALINQSGDIQGSTIDMIVAMASTLDRLTVEAGTEAVKAGSQADVILTIHGGMTLSEFNTKALAIGAAARSFHLALNALMEGNAVYSRPIRRDEGGLLTNAQQNLKGADASALRGLPEMAALHAELGA